MVKVELDLHSSIYEEVKKWMKSEWKIQIISYLVMWVIFWWIIFLINKPDRYLKWLDTCNYMITLETSTNKQTIYTKLNSNPTPEELYNEFSWKIITEFKQLNCESER